jgi:hypothetical protein
VGGTVGVGEIAGVGEIVGTVGEVVTFTGVE